MTTNGNEVGIPPHGLKRYRKPWNCHCDVCRAANTKYGKDRKAAIAAKLEDELATRRANRAKSQPRTPTSRSVKPRGASDEAPAKIGEMEQSIIDACKLIDRATEQPDMVMMARKMARILDNPKALPLHNSSTRQLTGIMATLRGTGAGSAGGKRKSGGRLATVQSMTRSKRG